MLAEPLVDAELSCSAAAENGRHLLPKFAVWLSFARRVVALLWNALGRVGSVHNELLQHMMSWGTSRDHFLV